MKLIARQEYLIDADDMDCVPIVYNKETYVYYSEKNVWKVIIEDGSEVEIKSEALIISILNEKLKEYLKACFWSDIDNGEVQLEWELEYDPIDYKAEYHRVLEENKSLKAEIELWKNRVFNSTKK